MNEQKKVLLISYGQKLSTDDKAALNDAGYLVVRVKFPADVRFLSPESPPMTANDMLRAAMVGINAITYDSHKARAWEALCKIVMPKIEASQSAKETKP